MAALTSSKNVLRQEIKDILKNINLKEKQKQSANIFKKVSLKIAHKSIICFRFLKRLCYVFDMAINHVTFIVCTTLLIIVFTVICTEAISK